MALRYYRNGPARQLAAPIALASDTSITVDSASGFPTQFPYTLILEPNTALEEVVDVTAAAGNILTVARGVDSTTASAHATGTVVYHGVSARDIREANAHVNATTAIHGSTGGLVDTDSVQSIAGRKLFTDAQSATGGSFVDTGTVQTITGAKTFSAANAHTGAATHTGAETHAGIETHSGAETHSGIETHSGAETHSGNEQFSGNLTFSGSNSHTGTETFTGPVSMDGQNVTDAWIAYTVNWRDGPGGTIIGIGNGTLNGFYKRIGKTVHFRITLVRGTSSQVGTTAYTFSLPLTPQDFRQAGTAVLYDDSALKYYGRSWHGIGASEIVILDELGARVTSTTLPWAVSDVIFISGTYETV